MHMATQPFMLPARMATIRCVLGMCEGEEREWLLVTGRRREDGKSKLISTFEGFSVKVLGW